MAKLSTAERNNLPDSAFAYIEPGGSTDAGGKTTPRSKRHFPIHDEGHVRDALARIAQGAEFGQEALPKVKAAARKFGIDVSEGHSAPRTPLELRRRRRGSMIRKQERRGMLLEMRSKPNGTGGTTFVFEGYGATFDDPFDMWDPWGDPYTEVLKQGAFTRTLARPDLDVPFLIGHNDAGIPLARTRNGTLKLSQDSRGLPVWAEMDGSRSDVRNLASAVERGDCDEMSIGFVTLGQEWSEDWDTRFMLDLELHRGDVSAVALAANPATRGASMTAFPVEAISQRKPGEQRGNPVDQDLGDAPDYNPMEHSPGMQHCTNPECPVDGGAMNGPDAKFCDQCGSDALVRLDDAGIPAMEEEHGAAASLAQARIDLERRRLLLLGLAG